MTYRRDLAVNLAKLIAKAKEDGQRHLSKPTAIQEATKNRVSKTQIYEALGERADMRLEHIYILANVFDVPAWALLVPGLDPHDPPVAGTHAQLRAMAWDLAQEAIDELRKTPRPGTSYAVPPRANPASKPRSASKGAVARKTSR